MSNTAFSQANGQMKWEVAGAAKKSKKTASPDQNERSPSFKQFKLLNSQMPKIEPMREFSIIFDFSLCFKA
jgi:hypothetical protein